MTVTKRFLAAAVTAVLLLSAVAWLSRKSRDTQTAALRTMTVSQGPIEDSVEATGSVLPLNRVEIDPPIAGRVDSLLVNEGDVVREGQTIAWMSCTDRAAILDAARARGTETLKEWQEAYKPTPILAPMAGTIILRNVVVGQTVTASTVLYAMSDRLIVQASVDESDIGRVHVGMSARITLDAYHDKPVMGKVTDILYEGKTVSNVITYGVKISPVTVPSFFRSEMTANVNFIVHRKNKALLIPASAIDASSGGGKQVLVLGSDGQPTPREIKTGLTVGTNIEVISGLSLRDRIVLSRGNYVAQKDITQSSPLAFKPPKMKKDQGGGPPPGGP
jgi:macrolide-specific efflux system membrane fusion protein